MTRFEQTAEAFADLVRCMETAVEIVGRSIVDTVGEQGAAVLMRLNLTDWFEEHGEALERREAILRRLRAINALRPGWPRYLMTEALVRHPAWRGRTR